MNATGTAPISAALPSIALEIGGGVHGAFVAQMVQTLSAIGMIAGAALAGYVSEWFGRRMVMLIATLAFILSGLAGLIASDIVSLASSRAITGFSSGVVLTTSYAVAAEHFQGDARNRILGFCSGGGAFASILLLAAAGPMVDAFGWRSIFWLFLLGLSVLPFILVHMHKGLPPRAVGEPLSWGPILALWPIWLVQIAFAVGVYMSVLQVPFIATTKGIVSASTISLLVATTSVAATAVGAFYGLIRRVLDVRGMFVLIAATFGFGLLICAGATSIGLFLVGAAILGIGAGALEPTTLSIAFRRTPETLHDRAAGAGVSTLFVGQFLNPLAVYPLVVIGGVNFAAGAFGVAYLVIGGLILIAGLVMRRRVPAHTVANADVC
jgi:MFS family permease